MTAPLRSGAARRAEARPPLRVLDRPARPPRSGRDRRMIAAVGGGLLFAAVLAGNVAVHAETTQGQLELERLETTARERQARYQQLRLRVAELEAPQRVVAQAGRMGMVEPDGVTYLTPTAQTSAAPPPPGPRPTPDGPDGEAAQGWAHVKPVLDRRR